MSDIIVYTCVAGRYDHALMPVVAEPGVRFVCFTDKPAHLKADGWEIRPLASSERLTDGHCINRFHKFFPHRLFPQAQWSIYIDGNLRFAGRFADLVARVRDSGADIGAFHHPHAHTLAREAEVCALSKFDARDFSVIDEQLRSYAADGIDLQQVIPACYVLVRDHRAAALTQAMSLWWSQIFEFCKRDQISFGWVVAKSGLRLQALDGVDEGAIDPALVTRLDHRKRPLWRRALRKVGQIIS